MRSLPSTFLLAGAVLTTSVGATPANAIRDAINITPRDIRGSLPAASDPMESKFQPAMDFDKDGCYYTSAMDPNGNMNPGLGAANGVPPNCLRAGCRDNNRLENNNVYSRKRCNNGWCAIMYNYYFEKDQVICGSWGAGHRHDWETIIVFIKDDQVKRVAPSCHNKYDKAIDNPPMDGSHPKIVYHKDGGQTHCFRIANKNDDKIENFTGKWFLGNVVGWNNYPNVGLRDKLVNQGQGAKPKFAEAAFVDHIKRAAGNSVPGFDPAKDG